MGKRHKISLGEKTARAAGHGDAYPLTAECIIDVDASLKEATYSSGTSYLLELKVEHVTRGHPMTETMRRLIDRCKASIERGMGAPARAMSFVLPSLRGGKGDDEEQARRSLVIATWWLLREIELSNIRIHSRQVKTKAD